MDQLKLTHACTVCHLELPADQYAVSRSGSRYKSCYECTSRIRDQVERIGRICSQCYLKKHPKEFFDPAQPNDFRKTCSYCRTHPRQAKPANPMPSLEPHDLASFLSQ